MSGAAGFTDVEVPLEKLFEGIERLLGLVGTMQTEAGLDDAQVLVVLLYAAGFVIGAGDGKPRWDAHVGEALPPMLDGWRKGQECRAKHVRGAH